MEVQANFGELGPQASKTSFPTGFFTSLYIRQCSQSEATAVWASSDQSTAQFFSSDWLSQPPQAKTHVRIHGLRRFRKRRYAIQQKNMKIRLMLKHLPRRCRINGGKDIESFPPPDLRTNYSHNTSPGSRCEVGCYFNDTLIRHQLQKGSVKPSKTSNLRPS